MSRRIVACSCRGAAPSPPAIVVSSACPACGHHFFGVRPSGGPLPAAFRPPGLPRCRSGAPGGPASAKASAVAAAGRPGLRRLPPAIAPPCPPAPTGRSLAPRRACCGPCCGPARQAAFRPALPLACPAGCRVRVSRPRSGGPAVRLRPASGCGGSPRQRRSRRLPSLVPRSVGGLVALRPWVLRAGALRRPRAAFFRPPAPALFGVDFYETPVLYSLLQGGALLLSIEKCLGLWPGRFSFFSPPPPPPPSGGGAQEGTTRSAPLRSKNGTPGFLRARKLHKTGILFNLGWLKKRGGWLDCHFELPIFRFFSLPYQKFTMTFYPARTIPTPSVSPISEN